MARQRPPESVGTKRRRRQQPELIERLRLSDEAIFGEGWNSPHPQIVRCAQIRLLFYRLRSHLINRRGCARAVRGGWRGASDAAHPPGSCRIRSEQRGQTQQSALVLGMASLFDLGGVAPRSQIATDMLPRHVLPKPKIDSHAVSPIYEMASSTDFVPKFVL